MNNRKTNARCQHAGCRGRAGLAEIATCRWCGVVHCAAHRIPEDHACAELTACRDEAFDRNRVRLEAAKCAKPRVAGGC